MFVIHLFNIHIQSLTDWLTHTHTHTHILLMSYILGFFSMSSIFFGESLELHKFCAVVIFNYDCWYRSSVAAQYLFLWNESFFSCFFLLIAFDSVIYRSVVRNVERVQSNLQETQFNLSTIWFKQLFFAYFGDFKRFWQDFLPYF